MLSTRSEGNSRFVHMPSVHPDSAPSGSMRLEWCAVTQCAVWPFLIVESEVFIQSFLQFQNTLLAKLRLKPTNHDSASVKCFLL